MSLSQSSNAGAGPSRPRKPFVSADHRPEKPDGLFRVLVISSGSVASIKIPEIVGALSKNAKIRLQVIATQASRYFYTQEAINNAVRTAKGKEPAVGSDADGADEDTVKVWTDEDEWADWKAVGDPILHIELRRWADLVVVAPCSADFLAKLAAGICDNLPLSVMRALPPSTPVVLCPAMNTMMYEHPFTADHLRILQSRLGYLVLGPQGAGTLACGDAGAGKMTDWKEIVSMIESLGGAFLNRPTASPRARATEPPSSASISSVPAKRPAEDDDQIRETDPQKGWPSMMGILDYRYVDSNQSTRPPPRAVIDPAGTGTDGAGAFTQEAAPHIPPAYGGAAAPGAIDPYENWHPGMMAAIDHRWAGKDVQYQPVEAFQYEPRGPTDTFAVPPPSAAQSAAAANAASTGICPPRLNGHEGGWAAHMTNPSAITPAPTPRPPPAFASAPGPDTPPPSQKAAEPAPAFAGVGADAKGIGRGDYYDIRTSLRKELYVPGLPTGEGVIGREGPSWTNEAFRPNGMTYREHMSSMSGPNGGEGTMWARKFWMG